jgi:hypothetical protein
MYYIFNFGYIDKKEDEDKYILSIISNLFSEDEENLKINTKNVISACHSYLRKHYDISVVSLREISRFQKCVKFFQEYYIKKNKSLDIEGNKKLEKLKSIILSIYICYYIRLTDEKIRNNFDIELKKKLILLVNSNSSGELPNFEEKSDLLSKIDEPLKSDIKKEITNNHISGFTNFSQLLLIEENFLIKEIKIDEGIGINKSLRDNIFLLFVALITKIPLIIIGKPGSGKSLSAHLMYKVMKGKYSDSNFFSNYPSIIQSYFQGSNSTMPEEVEYIFDQAYKKLNYFIEKKIIKEELPISMILFDELGLAEKSPSNPLKVLHEKLEDFHSKNYENMDCTEHNVSFIGISNWALDAAKINRALSLSVPDLDESRDDIRETSIRIAETYNASFKDNIFFSKILPETYYQYQEFLKQLKKLIAFTKYEWSVEFPKIKKDSKIEFENINNIEMFIKKRKKLKKK